MKFKSNIESQAGIEDSASSAGTAGQILSSLGPVAGVDGVSWIDQAEVVAAGATRVLIACKNTSGATITKGTPVYQTGNVGATDVIEIAEADALISTGYLPAIGLLETDLINNASGHVVITGELLNITTDPIDGLTPTTGDTIYLKSGGGLTLTKPTGEGNAIQNLGLVGKVSTGNAGSLTVASIMRQNDVPNLPTGKIWVGDGNTIVSDVIYLDETNDRMGIGTTNPQEKVHLSGSSSVRLEIESTDSTVAALKLTNTACSYASFVNNTAALMTYDYNAASIRTTLLVNGYFGIGTTNPGEKLEVNGSVKATASTDAYKGYIKQTIATIANEKAVGGSADYNLIPYNTLTTTTSNQYYNRMVAAYDGRIKKVYIRNTGGNTPNATVVNLKKQINNVTSGTPYSATVTGSGSGMSAYYDFANNDFTFNAGDTFGILYQTTDSGGGARTMGGVAISIIVEYNIT